MDNHTATVAAANPSNMAWADAMDALSDIESIARGLSELFAIMNEAAGRGISPESSGTFFVLGRMADEIADNAAKVTGIIEPVKAPRDQAEKIGA